MSVHICVDCVCVYMCIQLFISIGVCPYVSAFVNACASWCCVYVCDSVHTLFMWIPACVRKCACLPVKVRFPVCFIKCPLFISSFIAKVVCANSHPF